MWLWCLSVSPGAATQILKCNTCPDLRFEMILGISNAWTSRMLSSRFVNGAVLLLLRCVFVDSSSKWDRLSFRRSPPREVVSNNCPNSGFQRYSLASDERVEEHARGAENGLPGVETSHDCGKGEGCVTQGHLGVI
jgi:hypothetical protein